MKKPTLVKKTCLEKRIRKERVMLLFILRIIQSSWHFFNAAGPGLCKRMHGLGLAMGRWGIFREGTQYITSLKR